MVYAYDPLASLLPFLFLFLVVIVLAAIFSPSRSKRYRKEMTDLYIVGKIKLIADEDGVDIAAEYEKFKKWLKKQKIEDEALDSTIERELQEQINLDEKVKGGTKNE